MKKYLNDTEFATKTLFELLIADKENLEQLKEQLENLKTRFEHFQSDFNTYDLSEDYDDMQLQHKFYKMAKTGEEVQEMKTAIQRLEQEIHNKEISYRTLGMAILQIAKQGLSIVHGSLSAIPAGRTIGSQDLKDIIWQSRNQSNHYEEGNYRKGVTDCFNILKNEFGEDFNLSINGNTNLSTNIIYDVLCWQNYEDYKNDMLLLK